MISREDSAYPAGKPTAVSVADGAQPIVGWLHYRVGDGDLTQLPFRLETTGGLTRLVYDGHAMHESNDPKVVDYFTDLTRSLRSAAGS